MAPDAPEREPEMRRYAALPMSKNYRECLRHSRYFLFLYKVSNLDTIAKAASRIGRRPALSVCQI